MLAKRGVHPLRIESLGRWRSPLVVHYAGESLAVGLARELRSSVGDPAPAESSALREIRAFLGRLDRRLTTIESAEAELVPDSDIPPPPQPHADDIIRNTETGAYHRSRVPASAAPELQKTACGWSFVTRRYYRLTEIPADTPF